MPKVDPARLHPVASPLPWRVLAWALAAVLAGWSGTSRAVDGVSLEVGESTSSYTDVTVTRIGVLWNWQGKWLTRGDWHLGGYWDAAIGYWHVDADASIRVTNHILEVGLTPMLRWQLSARQALSPFIDFGIGIRLVDENAVTLLRDLSGPVLFGSVIGAGFQFGPKGYALSYRFQHLSTGGLKEPNNGVNVQSIRLHHTF